MNKLYTNVVWYWFCENHVSTWMQNVKYSKRRWTAERRKYYDGL